MSNKPVYQIECERNGHKAYLRRHDAYYSRKLADTFPSKKAATEALAAARKVAGNDFLTGAEIVAVHPKELERAEK